MCGSFYLTKLCPANCEHCFSRSNMHRSSGIEEKYQFSEYGVERLIKFINDSNSLYVMMSGGGEPMIHKKAVNSIIRQAKTDRIVIVTNYYLLFSNEEAKSDNENIIKVMPKQAIRH